MHDKKHQTATKTTLVSKTNLSLFEKHRALEALLVFIEQLNSINAIDDVIWHLAHHTIRALNFEDCVIYLYDEEKDVLLQKAAYGPKNPERFEILDPISIKIGEGIVGRAAKEKQYILIDDTLSDPDYIVDDSLRNSELAVPIIFRGKLLGVIDSEHSLTGFFTNDHRRYVEILASVLASKIALESNIQTLEKTLGEKTQSQNLTDIYFKISELTHNARSDHEFYSTLRQVIIKAVNTESFFVVLFDKSSNTFSFPHIFDEQLGGQVEIDVTYEEMKHSLVAKVIETQTPYIATKEELKKRFKKSQTLRKGIPAVSWLAVPFEISETKVGAIALQSYQEDIIFNDKDLTFLSYISQHVSVAIDRNLKDQKLQHQALHDPVTKLANRSLFIDRLEHTFLRCKRINKPSMAVLFIDFDNFKQVNDSFGHAAGDKLLLESAKRMASQLRESDTLARIGGDEFAILLESLEDSSLALAIAKRLLSSMKASFEVNEKKLYATVSIGIAFNDENCEASIDLMKNADHAMYHAKRDGKNKIKIYESSLHSQIVYARQLVNELEVAIEENQLIFYYQPIVSLAEGLVVGFEALVRWEHPEKGIIGPGEFIQVAEQYDLIKKIDKKLLNNAAETIARWSHLSKKPPYLSINLSAQRFADSDLLSEVTAVFNTHALPHGSLVIEVTEHMLMENIGKARLLFHQLKSLGIKISLDDFGTGYSSLSYLNQLPFDILKIDRSFIANIQEEEQKTPIINAIIALASSLEIGWIAEGIETNTQLKKLQAMQCPLGQGFYLSRPMPEKEADLLVTKKTLQFSQNEK